MEYTVKALADLAGVTPRTLRWYDRIGLLKPLRTTEAGYRLYGPAQLDRLQDILFYRELFYWNLGFTVKNPKNAEPSDWYVFSSLLGMGIITAVVLVLYVVQAYNIFD